METICVENLADPRLVDYRNIKDADLRRQRGLFMAEGRLVVELLVSDSLYSPDSLFLNRRSYNALRPVLEELGFEAPVYVAEQEVFNQIVGFNMHRGCLAAGQVGELPTPHQLLAETTRPGSLIVIAEGLTNTENMGGVFRNAMAFGADAVLLCPKSCDPLYRKSIRVSMGGTLRIPSARFDTWPGPLADVRAAGYQVVALDLDENAVSLQQLGASIAPDQRVALLLGTEGRGISDVALKHVDLSVQIPMVQGVDSLNVATASGIAMQFLYAHSLTQSANERSQT